MYIYVLPGVFANVLTGLSPRCATEHHTVSVKVICTVYADLFVLQLKQMKQGRKRGRWEGEYSMGNESGKSETSIIIDRLEQNEI